jgi:integrase
VGHAHRLLRTAVERARRTELVSRNAVSAIHPPKVTEKEIEIIKSDQLPAVLAALKGHALEHLVIVALASGARRGELLALRWIDIDFQNSAISITRSLEQTKAGLRVKAPKTKNGIRKIAIATNAMEVLRAHRKEQLELRLKFGLGKLDPDALVFSNFEGASLPPNNVSRDWRRFALSRGLPHVSFHALRHTHVSCLIAAGMDVMAISRRIGHGSAALTLKVYGHLFRPADDRAAAAMDAILG